MSVIINGKRYVAAYLNGKRYDKGYFNGKLVLVTPDNNAYLMAADGVHLRVNNADLLAYDIVPQVVHKLPTDLGTLPFKVSFEVHSDLIGEGLCYLFDFGGLLDCKSHYGTLAFRFNWQEKPDWKFVQKEAIVGGWNKVELVSEGGIIRLKVNGYSWVVLDSTVKQEVMPIINNGLNRTGNIISGTGTKTHVAMLKETVYWGALESWKIEVKYTHKDGGGGYPSVFGPYSGSLRNCPELEIDTAKGNQLYANLCASSTSPLNGGSYVEEYLVDGKTYYFVLEFTGREYLLRVSEDKLTWREHLLYSGAVKLYNATSGTNLMLNLLNSRISDGTRYSMGSIDLSELRVTVNDGNSIRQLEMEEVYPVSYPPFTVGTLTVKQDWEKLTNFKAITLGE